MFRKSAEKIQFSLKSDTDNVYVIWKPSYVNYNVSLNSSYNKKIFDKSCRENQNKHFVSNNLYSQKWCCLWDNVKKYVTVGQATDDSSSYNKKFFNKSCRENQNTHSRLISFACSATMATDAHSDYWIPVIE